MAGYFISSIDPNQFEDFIQSPSAKQLRQMAKLFTADRRESLPANDPLRQAVGLPDAGFAELIKHRLSLSDWYSDLSPAGCSFWERVICDICNGIDLRPEIEESVYWWVWDIISETFCCENDGTVDQDIPFSSFGTKPFRYFQGDSFDPGNRIWVPYHSLHTAGEVNQMADELDELEEYIEDCDDESAVNEFHNQFAPAIQNIADNSRMMLVVVDT